MSTEAKSLSVMEGIPTSVIPYDEYNTLQKPKAIYYEIAFRDEPEGGNKNILSVPVDAAPPEVGKTMYYTTAVIDTKTGPITRIVWPISPQLIPRKVTEPVENPVKDAVTEPAPQEEAPQKPYKAPDTDRKIIRQASMKAAVEYYASCETKLESPMEGMTAMAQQWEEWIFRSVDN